MVQIYEREMEEIRQVDEKVLCCYLHKIHYRRPDQSIYIYDLPAQKTRRARMKEKCLLTALTRTVTRSCKGVIAPVFRASRREVEGCPCVRRYSGSWDGSGLLECMMLILWLWRLLGMVGCHGAVRVHLGVLEFD